MQPGIMELDLHGKNAYQARVATDAALRRSLAALPDKPTVFIVSQRVSSLQHADLILVLDDGVISGFDTHENLLKTNPIYQDVYESQTSGNGDFDEGSDH